MSSFEISGSEIEKTHRIIASLTWKFYDRIIASFYFARLFVPSKLFENVFE